MKLPGKRARGQARMSSEDDIFVLSLIEDIWGRSIPLVVLLLRILDVFLLSSRLLEGRSISRSFALSEDFGVGSGYVALFLIGNL